MAHITIDFKYDEDGRSSHEVKLLGLLEISNDSKNLQHTLAFISFSSHYTFCINNIPIVEAHRDSLFGRGSLVCTLMAQAQARSGHDQVALALGKARKVAKHGALYVARATFRPLKEKFHPSIPDQMSAREREAQGK